MIKSNNYPKPFRILLTSLFDDIEPKIKDYFKVIIPNDLYPL